MNNEAAFLRMMGPWEAEGRGGSIQRNRICVGGERGSTKQKEERVYHLLVQATV